jgi:hypothetical protein
MMLRPATGTPLRPARLRVADRGFADALAAEIGTGLLSVEVADSLETHAAVASDLLRSLGWARAENLPPLPDTPLHAQFFRTAAAFYNARPWQYLSDASPLVLEISGQRETLVTVLGNAGIASGLALFPDSATLDALAADPSLALDADSLSFTFAPEADVDPAWQKARGARRWPIASPSAFPVALARRAGAAALPDESELWLLDAAAAAVAALAAKHGPALERGEDRELGLELPDPGGGSTRVRVLIRTASADSGAPSSPEEQAIESVISAAIRLPDSRATLGRLAWSFYRDGGPSYVEPAGMDAAEERFVTWAVFAAKPQKRTLAERGVEAIEPTLSPEALKLAKRVARPRIGVFRVEFTAAARKPGRQLREEATGKTFRLQLSEATRDIEPGMFLLGTVHPVGRGEVVLGDGAVTATPTSRTPARIPVEGPTEFGPALEEGMFGAGTGWIQEIAAPEVREAYDEFRDALAATGDRLPTYAEFQVLIRRAAMPLDIFRKGFGFEWWTEIEVHVMMAFLMRIWNLTSRAELGGRSPDQMAAMEQRR